MKAAERAGTGVRSADVEIPIEDAIHMTGTASSGAPVAGRLRELQEIYEAFKAKGLKLNLTRGKPSAAQLELSEELLALPGAGKYMAEGAMDCRNYGGLQGLAEARRLFAGMLGAPAEQVVVANNSSLALMHDCVTYALLKGTCDSAAPWGKQGEIAFVCPVPGYDRHFRICEDYGIRMIPVALREDGPDMEEVERLVAGDASIKGMWCMPKYSNPTGTTYSDAVIGRLAAMKTAAPDFPVVLGQRLCGAPSDRGTSGDREHAGAVCAARAREPGVRVCVHLEDHVGGDGAGAVCGVEGKREVAADENDATDRLDRTN